MADAMKRGSGALELEFLEKWLDELRKSSKLAIVEGKKDKSCLEKLGIWNILSIDRRPLFEVCEHAASISRRIVILTDLDNEGKKLYGKLSTGLQHLGIEIDNYFREALYRNTKLRQVEGLDSYARKLDAKEKGNKK